MTLRGAAFVVVVMAVVATGCGGSGRGTTITVYNGQHPQLTTTLVAAFEKATGIHVKTLTNDGVVLADQLLEEGTQTSADVYLTENSPELMLLQEHHLLAPLPAATLAEAPSQDSSPQGDWVGVARRVSCLAYDPSLVAKSGLPTSLLGLADPQWKGKVAIAPTDSDFFPLVSGVIALYGKATALDWLQGLKRNAHLYADDESVVAAVNRGAAGMGIINQYYWYRLRFEIGTDAMHSALSFFSPQDVGSLVNISGAAVLAGSKHPQAAQRFVAFLDSAQAQTLLSQGDDFEYPVRPGTGANPALAPFASLAPLQLSVTRLGDDAEAASLLQQAGLA
jgi:iron(III) transport system substrate-binding protein